MPDRTIKMLEDHMSHLQKTIELMRAGKMKTQSFKDGTYVDTTEEDIKDREALIIQATQSIEEIERMKLAVSSGK